MVPPPDDDDESLGKRDGSSDRSSAMAKCPPSRKRGRDPTGRSTEKQRRRPRGAGKASAKRKTVPPESQRQNTEHSGHPVSMHQPYLLQGEVPMVADGLASSLLRGASSLPVSHSLQNPYSLAAALPQPQPSSLVQLQPSVPPTIASTLLQSPSFQQYLLAPLPSRNQIFRGIQSITPVLAQTGVSGRGGTSASLLLPGVLESLQNQRILSLLQGSATTNPTVVQHLLQPQIRRIGPVGGGNLNQQLIQNVLAAPSTSAPIGLSLAYARGATSAQHSFPPKVLAHADDKKALSPQQVFLRRQIEVFCAGDEDISTHKRGRNKPITKGQVGIRCRHCSHLPIGMRQKGSTYFPASLQGIYQAAQNMCTAHMQCGLCSEMPEEIKREFARLLVTKTLRPGAGRHYWAESAKNLGLIDTEEEGIRVLAARF